jgi:hypothetical protein
VTGSTDLLSRGAAVAVAVVLAAVALASWGCEGRPGTETLARATSGPSATLVVTGDREQVGFDARVALRAAVVGGPPSVKWAITWTPIWGPPLRESKVGEGTLEFVTPAAPPVELAAAHPRYLVPLSAEVAGRTVLRVEARGGEDQRLETVVEVFPAFPSAAWPRLARGADAYLGLAPPPAGAPRGSWTVKRGAVTVAPARVPHLARIRGLGVDWYTMIRPDGTEAAFRGGVWLGGRDCGRFDCHPREQRGWLRTAHASVLTRALSGLLPRTRGAYQEHCMACHTLGYQPGRATQNDGFEDRASAAGWTFPAEVSPAVWRAVPQPLKERSNVQCESCHGSGWFYVGYGEDICAQCHDHPPQYQVVAQWRRNRMSQAQGALAGNDPGPACPECHSAAGFLRSLRGHGSTSRPEMELETEKRGVTCAVCHDPHGDDCRRQLRLCGEVETPGRTFDAGQGALCISCHTGDANIVRGSLLRPFVPGRQRTVRGHGRDEASQTREPEAAPHAPQFQILTGRGGKYLRLPDTFGPRPVNPHLLVPDSCVGCHYHRASKGLPRGGHSFKLLGDPRPQPAPALCAARVDLSSVRASPATGSCSPCHGRLSTLDARARGDYDGDGRVGGLVEEVEHLLGMLKKELEHQIGAQGYRDSSGREGSRVTVMQERLVVTDAECQPLRKGGGWFSLPPGQSLLHKAAFNYLMVLRDGSGGLHNPHYVVDLLQNTLAELEKARGASARHRWKTP